MICKGLKAVVLLIQYFNILIAYACAHRDYSLHGSRIRIFIFSDRIEFISSGRLPNSVSIEKIKMGVSYARNPVFIHSATQYILDIELHKFCSFFCLCVKTRLIINSLDTIFYRYV